MEKFPDNSEELLNYFELINKKIVGFQCYAIDAEW